MHWCRHTLRRQQRGLWLRPVLYVFCLLRKLVCSYHRRQIYLDLRDGVKRSVLLALPSFSPQSQPSLKELTLERCKLRGSFQTFKLSSVMSQCSIQYQLEQLLKHNSWSPRIPTDHCGAKKLSLLQKHGQDLFKH